MVQGPQLDHLRNPALLEATGVLTAALLHQALGNGHPACLVDVVPWSSAEQLHRWHRQVHYA